MMCSRSMRPANRGPAAGARAARWFAVAFAAVVLAACAAPPRTAPAPQPRTLPAGLAWMWQSAEYRALARQTYAVATARLEELAPAIPASAWGVILDADETVLDNTTYEIRRAGLDSAYTEPSWSAWVREEAAPAVPGAVAFTRRVHELGGRVIIVTNRADSLCGPTRGNLQHVGVDADLVLCQPPGQPDKNPRFDAVRRGTASPALPAARDRGVAGRQHPGLPDAAAGLAGRSGRDGAVRTALFRAAESGVRELAGGRDAVARAA